MCHLNILIQKENTLNKLGFLMAVTSNSYASNSDGDGINTNATVRKSKTKLNLFKYNDDILKSNIILCHERIATSGFNKKFLQPFINKEFVLIHNGVISEFAKNNKSDTYNLFNKFKKDFDLIEGTNREEKIIKTIQNIFNKLSGSYSICIKDLLTNEVYYFKNSTTTIKGYKSPNSLYLTTSNTNEKFLSMLGENFKEIKIKDYVIYRLGFDNFKELALIEEPEKIKFNYNYTSNYYNTQNKYGGYVSSFGDYSKTLNHTHKTKSNNQLSKKQLKKINNIKMNLSERDLLELENNCIDCVGELQTATTEKCFKCGELTHYYNVLYNSNMCLECYDLILSDMENYFLMDLLSKNNHKKTARYA